LLEDFRDVQRLEFVQMHGSEPERVLL
jgi:hypothetical protein